MQDNIGICLNENAEKYKGHIHEIRQIIWDVSKYNFDNSYYNGPTDEFLKNLVTANRLELNGRVFGHTKINKKFVPYGYFIIDQNPN